jgi:hypothetical protein
VRRVVLALGWNAAESLGENHSAAPEYGTLAEPSGQVIVISGGTALAPLP